MKKAFLIITYILSIYTTDYAQKTIPLYEGQAPNSKPNIGLTDTALVFKMGAEMGHFIIRVITPELTMYLPEKEQSNGFGCHHLSWRRLFRRGD